LAEYPWSTGIVERAGSLRRLDSDTAVGFGAVVEVAMMRYRFSVVAHLANHKTVGGVVDKNVHERLVYDTI
jgi:hypothetical protein